MKRNILIAVSLIGTLTAYAQKPAVTPKPEAPQAAAPAPGTPPPPTPQEVKAMKDAYDSYQLDLLESDTAQNKYIATDPLAQRAKKILNDAVLSSPDVQKAAKQAELDRADIIAKVQRMREERHLDNTWDYNFNTQGWVRVQPPPPPTPAQAK